MSLRKKYVNSTLLNKVCFLCKKEYPRTDQYFYIEKHSSAKDRIKYASSCIKCDNARSAAWKKENRERVRKTQRKYLETENGYFNEKWNKIRISKHGCLFRTFEEFFKCWEEQKKLYGWKCPYLGIEMTMKKGINKDRRRKNSTDTNISPDRLMSNLPYGRENIMFVSWRVNNQKGNITPYIARKYLQFIDQKSLLKKLSNMDKNNLVGDKEEWFEWIDAKKKITSMLKEIDATAKDVDGKSFITNEFKKLGKMLSKEEWKGFAEIAYQRHLVEKEKERPYETQ